MTRLMDRTDLFNRILGGLHRAVLDDAHWSWVSGLIDRACRSRGNILIYGDASSHDDATLSFARFCYRGQRREDRERLYLNNYFPTDKIVPRVLALNRGRLTHLPSLYTEQELKTSRTYREAHPVFHTDDSLLALLHGPGGSSIFWANANPVDSSGWGTDRTGTIRRLLPHIGQYVRVRQALVDAQALTASLGALLDHSRLGILQLDLRGRLVEANDLALGLLRSADALYDEDGTLRAVSPADDARLQHLLERALRRFDEPGTSGSMAVSRLERSTKLMLHVLPTQRRDTDFRTRQVAALVVLAESGTRPPVDPALVTAVLGLTPAQGRVAALLAGGNTPDEIAAATGRKVSTVRWHIKKIFARTGVSRQAELLQLVSALSNFPGKPR